jgi:hypothetical protein
MGPQKVGVVRHADRDLVMLRRGSAGADVGHLEQSFFGDPKATLANTSRRWERTTPRRPFKPAYRRSREWGVL